MSAPYSRSRAALCVPLLFALLSSLIACGPAGVTPPGNKPTTNNAGGDDDSDEGSTDEGTRDAPAQTSNADGGQRKQDASVRPQDAGKLLDASNKPPTGDSSTPAPAVDAGKDVPDSAAPVASSSFADSTLVPHASWTCGLPEGIPSPVGAPLVFTAELAIANVREVGDTQFGKRQLIELNTGTFKGDKLDAALQAGGLDQPLLLANGALELEEILTLKTKDGKYIYLRVCGTAPNADEPMRVVMDFEAPNGGAYAFLNTAKLVGTRTVDTAAKKLTLSVYDVSKVDAASNKISIENPAGVVDQTWDCKTDKGTAGEQIYKEVVNIGSSLSVGASKRGNRNIIPITGGTTTGRIKGSVLPGGGDFQILDSGFVLDARYTMRADDGELILVRNCGPASALVPVFEARAEGPYAFLNANQWLSSSPSVGLGTVTLTITEKR